NGIDPTGRMSLSSTLGTLAVGSFLTGTLGGAALGLINGSVGYATGQMDFQSATESFAKFTLLGAGAGSGAALFALQFKLVSVGVGATLFVTEVAGGGLALW